MISLEDVARVIGQLNEQEQSLVIDFARMLRDREQLRVPENMSLEGPEYRAWQERVATRATRVLADQRRRLEALGLPPDGRLPDTEWPPDMAAASKSSVET